MKIEEVTTIVGKQDVNFSTISIIVGSIAIWPEMVGTVMGLIGHSSRKTPNRVIISK